MLPLSSGPTAAVPAAGTRVGASHPETILTVGASHTVFPVQGRCEPAPQPQLAVGACVAAEDDAAAAGDAGTLERSPWPPNRGFLGDPVETTLKPGTLVDRYGGSGGTFVSPEGTPFEGRSLRSTAINSPYNVYEVVKPVTVQGGIAAPAFGYGGGGIQYEFGSPIQDLIDQGILKRVGP